MGASGKAQLVNVLIPKAELAFDSYMAERG